MLPELSKWIMTFGCTLLPAMKTSRSLPATADVRRGREDRRRDARPRSDDGASNGMLIALPHCAGPSRAASISR